MSRYDDYLAEAEAARFAADDLAETAARARTGDLEPDGSWSLAPPSTPSLGDAALSGLAGGLINGVLSAILGSGKRRAHRSMYHSEHAVNTPIVQVVHVPRAGDYVVNVPHWGERVVSVPYYGECVVHCEGHSLVLKVAR